MNRLTAKQIKAAAPGDKLHDGGGLLFVASAEGGRWKFRFQIDGKRREMGLGSYPNMSLADARKERAKWAAVKEAGQDPIRERERQRKAEQAQAGGDPTFEEMAHIAFEARKERLRGDGERGRWFSPLRLHVIPKIGRLPVSSLTQRDIHDALKPIWRRKHATAKKAMHRTHIVLRHARLSGYDVAPFIFIADAAQHMLGFVDHRPEPIAATPWQDVPGLYARLCEKPPPSYLALRFAILTAARSAAIRGARFDEIDGDVWTVPADRVKGQRGKVDDFRVPLSSEALSVVEACRAHRVTDRLRWAIPSAAKGTAI